MKNAHIIEFEHLRQQEINRMCKWATTCTFHKWHTQSRTHLFAFVFENRMDAERFIMQWSPYFSNPNTLD